MERETISQQTHLDDQRKLMMALQALVNLEQFTVLAHLLAGEQSLLQLATELKLEPSLTRGPIGRLIFLELISVREEPGRIMCSLNRERFYALNGALQQFAKTLFAAERAPLPSDPAAGGLRRIAAFWRAMCVARNCARFLIFAMSGAFMWCCAGWLISSFLGAITPKLR